MKKLLPALLFAVITVSCNSNPADKVNIQEVALAAPPPSSEPVARSKDIAMDEVNVGAAENTAVTPDQAAITRKIIKEGDIAFETTDLKAAHKRITDTLKKLGGYVEEEKEENNEYAKRKNYILNIRVPAQNFERFLGSVSIPADRIESKSIRVKDVTTQYIDVSTRLNNQQLLESRYKALLSKSAKMSDILEIENKLSEIRTNIETTQGELNYLNKQVTYSSLNITFFTRYASENNDGSGFGYRFKTAIAQSLELVQNIFFGLITSWPVVLVVVVLLFLFRRWKRKRLGGNN